MSWKLPLLSKNIPFLGLYLLIITIVMSAIFLTWTMSPLSHEKAKIMEKKGHKLTKDGKYKQAYLAFISSAEIRDDALNTSRRYRCAGTVASDIQKKIKSFSLALKYNPKNENAIKGIRKLLSVLTLKDFKMMSDDIIRIVLGGEEIQYLNRYADGWSKGAFASIIVNAPKSRVYTLKQFTSSPEKRKFLTNISLDGKSINKNFLEPGKKIITEIKLKSGINYINVTVDRTFNLKDMNAGKDARDLGVNVQLNIAGRKYDSLNNIKHKNPDKSISFISGGHLYGSPRSFTTLFPAPAFIANMDYINEMNANFFMGLGDIVNSASNARFKVFDDVILKKLKIPFYNALGNHDISTSGSHEISNKYGNYFGLKKYYFSFRDKINAYVVLDTETNAGKIVGKQLDFFKNSISQFSNDTSINNIFIFSHKLIWSHGSMEKYNIVYNHVNAKTGYDEMFDFGGVIMPVLQSSDKQLFWISGDIGVEWTLPVFYDEYSDNLKFIAIGMGDTKDDMLLKTDINVDGEVKFNLFSLIDKDRWFALEKYNIDYWNKRFSRIKR